MTPPLVSVKNVFISFLFLICACVCSLKRHISHQFNSKRNICIHCLSFTCHPIILIFASPLHGGHLLKDTILFLCSILEYEVLVGEIIFSVPTATVHQKKHKAVASKFRMAIMPSNGTGHLYNFFSRRNRSI